MDNPETIKLERLNYFRGMYTSAKDWEDEQKYHLEKFRLANRVLRNKPGIIKGVAGELAVLPDNPTSSPTDGSVFRVVVQPGAAVDPLGNLLYLDCATHVELRADSTPTDAKRVTVYVAIKHHEVPRSYSMHPSQPEYSGFTRILEEPTLRATTEPLAKEELELAQVEFEPGNAIIRIDRSAVRWSPTVAEEIARLDGLGVQFNGHGERLDKHEQTLREHSQELDKHDRAFGEHNDRIVKEERKSADFEARLTRLDDHSGLRSRGLHTPGIMRSELQEFKVEPAGGLEVLVHSGAALDGLGNTIVFNGPVRLRIEPVTVDKPEWIYIVVQHSDGRPSVTRHAPDNRIALELARIDLYPDATGIEEPADAGNPGPNQINRCERRWAGAVCTKEELMAAPTRQRIIQAMEPTRRNFVALDDRFPTPSASDVRHSALTVATLARIGCLQPEQLPDLLATLASIEQDVGNEIHKKYGNIVNGTEEFLQYRTAIADVMSALRLGNEDAILAAQSAVASAAYVLAMVAVENPIADAGVDQNISIVEDEVTVRLDAHRSAGRGGRSIEWYEWDRAA